jgi:hypothetical protein
MADGDQQRLSDSSSSADSSFPGTPPGSTVQPCHTPKIYFTRGIILALPETSWSWLQTEVVTPLPGPVVKRLQKYKKLPRDSELVQVCVTNAAASSATISGGAASVTVDLQAQDGDYLSVKKILCWYGDGDGIDPNGWDNIQLVEVTSGDAFVTEITATAQGVSANLGMLDIRVTDPDDGTSRSLRYSLHRSRKPSLKFLTPIVNVDNIKIILDDGDNTTPDTVDITSAVQLQGASTDYSGIPDWVDQVPANMTIQQNTDRGRLRAVVASVLEGEPDAGRIALFMNGENRVRMEYTRKDGIKEILYHAHSLNYLDTEKAIENGHFDEEKLGDSDDAITIKKSTLLFDYKDDQPGLQMSSVLHALRFRPQALSPKFKIVEARSEVDLDTDALIALHDEINGYNDEVLESVTVAAIHPFDPVPNPENTSLISRAIHADFAGVPTRIFNNANLHWHHFVIHTFPALRMIETQLFPHRRPTVVQVTGFEHDKTFVGPATIGGVIQLVATNNDEGDTKIALFGMCEGGYSTADHRNQLSLRRATSLWELLRHKMGFWFDQFAAGTEPVANSTPEIEFALMRLGYYAGPISGASNPDLTSVCRKFEATEGLAGPASGWQPTASARTRMSKRLHESLGATGASKCPDTKWGITEIQYMLVQVGDLTPPFSQGVNDATTIAAAKTYQQGKSLTQDGIVGLCTRIALIEDYMNSVVPAPFTDDRFYPSAQFGCRDSHPLDPANPAANPLDNRVDAVFRKSSIDPIDPAVFGAGVPYADWVRDLDDSEMPAIPKVVVAISDTGLGAGENFSGTQSGLANDYHIKGERMLRPTSIIGIASGNANTAVVQPDGNLGTVVDPAGHGTAVMTCMAADGVGSPVGGVPRNQANVVIGVAPHIKIRPIQIVNTVLTQLVNLELMADDPEVMVHSTSTHLYWNPTPGTTFFVSPQQWRAIEQRTQDFMTRGKIVFASAGNFRFNGPGFIANTYDTATRQWGRFATERTTSRSNAAYSGANQYRQNVCIVGSSAEVGSAGAPIVVNAPNQQDIGAAHTYIGEQVSVHTPGERIRAVLPNGAPNAAGLSNPTAAIGLTIIGGIGGTSFATPMTAGIAGELMLLDPALRQAANMPRVIEYIEATSDPLPPLNPAGGSGAAGGNPRNADPGPAAGVPPTGPQLPNQPAAYANIRRVHYWKAVLAALNQGLSAEGRGADGAQDAFFQFCTLRGHANTKFYGFELRSEVPGAFIWLHTWAGHYQIARDPGAMLPGNATIASTWISSTNYQLAPNQPLPNFPWPQASFAGTAVTPQYLCQISFEKARLALFDAIEIHLPDNDPNRPVAPSLLSIPLIDYGALRTPTAQPANTVIQTFIDAFDDFVFHCRDNPKVITALQLFSAKGSTDVAIGESVDILIYGVDQFGFLVIQMPAAPAPVISHNGTPGQAAPAAGVSLNGAPAPQAGVPYVFGAVPNKPFMAKVPFMGNTAEAVTLTAVDGAGRNGTLTLNVAAAGAIATFALTIRQRGGGKLDGNPPHTGDLLEVQVVANDASGLVVTGFAGDVTLSVTQGQKGTAAGGKRGLQVKNADADPFSDAAFTYTFAAADQGVHVFNLIDYTAGPLQLTATSNAISGTSNVVNVLAGGLVSFQIDAPGNLVAGKGFQAVVTALDANGERIEDFVNTVTLSLNTGTAPATAADGTRSGLFIDNPTHDYELPDAGRFAFDMVGYTAEGILLDATSGGVTTTSAPIVIQAGGALDHSGFEVSGGARAGRTMQVKVIPQDANNGPITSFAGAVTLNVTTGTAYAAGAPNVGVKVETAPGTIGNNHNFVPADNGAFVFLVTPYTAEVVVVTAVSGAVATAAPAQNVTADVVANFLVVVGAIPAGGPITTVTVTARDAFNNVCQNYMGAVTINLNQAGLPPAQAAQYTFTSADAGVRTFNAIPVAAIQRGNNLYVTATDGNTSASVGPLNA